MRHAIHKLICWYLRRCAGAFHCYNYGETGRYVVLMNEGQYSNYQKASARCSNAKAQAQPPTVTTERKETKL